MPQGEIQPRWLYTVTDVSANRRAPRTAIPAQYAAQVIGIDGNDEGGLRPSTGFAKVVDLEYGYGNDAHIAVDDGLGQGGTMTNIFGVTMRVGDSTYAYGFVWRVLSDDGAKAVYRLQVRVGDDLTWKTDHDFGLTGGLIGAEAYAGEQFHVEVQGRFVYCFRSGKRPFMFYLTDPGTGVELRVETTTGPGVAPVVLNPSPNGASAIVTAEVSPPRTANADILAVLTAMSPPATGDASARVLYFGFSNLKKVSSDGGINYINNPYLPVRAPRAAPSTIDLPIKGPSDLSLWTTPPQPDPTFGDILWYVNGAPRTPTYTSPNTEFEGLSYNKGARQANEPIGLGLDQFVWAYRLYDSNTGRYSPISNRIGSSADTFGSASLYETFDDTGAGRQSVLKQVTFPLFQIIYRPDRYDTLLLYRGYTQTGVTADQAILSLDSVVTLADYQIATQPMDTSWKVAACFAVSSDEELSQQASFQGDDTYLEQMPYAGSAIFYESTMLMGKLGTVDPAVGGLGKIVWSSLTEISVELVSASSLYPLQLPDEEVLRFCRLGPNIVALSRVSQYLVRREINYLKAQPMHFGFGVVSPRAACELASEAYFVCDQGLFSISADGSLQAITVVQDIIKREWAATLSGVELAFDSSASAVFMLNPSLERMAVLWQTSQKLSEFYDTNFIHAFEGDVPYSVDTAGSRLQRRAMFVQYIQTDASTKKWRVFCMDYNRAKPTISTLNPLGTLVMTVGASGYTAGATTLVVTSGTATQVEGCYLYVLEGPYYGRRIKVTYRQDTTTYAVTAASFSLAAGTKVGISPMYFQWVGTLLGIQDPNGISYAGADFHSTRHIDGLAAAFTDVTWIGDDADAKYVGLIYSGTDTLPTAMNIPLANDGTSVRSVENGVSAYVVAFGDQAAGADDPPLGIHGNALFPGVRIFVPGLDFRLLAVRVDGTIRDDDAIRNRPTS